jgi:glycosyltransferase involved in cell wall biosynthesis
VSIGARYGSVHVLVLDPYTEICGPHQVLARIVEHLNGRRFSFSAVVPAKGSTYSHLEALGIRVHTVDGVDAVRRGSGAGGWWRLGWNGMRAIRPLVSLVRDEHVDLVHTASAPCWVGGVAARAARVPSVYHVHDLTLSSTAAVGCVVGTMLSLLADRIICVSKAAKAALPHPRLTGSKSCVVHNAVDLQKFCPHPESRQSMRTQLGLGENTLLVGTFGALDWRKGQDIFVRAAALVSSSVSDVAFLVVGGDSPGAREHGYGQRVRELARQLGLHNCLHFLGARDDVPRLMQAMDLVVQPSRIDAGPIVPLEAMATQIPVVATLVGANPEEIEDQVTGILVPPEDQEAMACAIVSLLQDKACREQLGRSGRDRVQEHFDLSKQIRCIAKIYDDLIYQQVS